MRHSITPWISLALAASLSLGLSVSAAAQPDTDTALRDASQQFLEGDQAGAIETARRGLELAITPSEQFNGHYLLADMSSQTGDHATAYTHFTQALGVLETHAPDQHAMQAEVMHKIGYEAFQLGRREEWIEWGERAQTLIRANLSILFRFEEDDLARHRMSAFACDPGQGEIERTNFTVYMASGRDVACVYSVQGNEEIAMTVHVSHQPGISQAQAFAGADQAVRTNRQAADQLDRGRRDFGGVPVEYALYREQTMTTGVYTTQIDDWTVKLRLTDYRSVLSDADWDAAAELTFGGTADMAAHAENCDTALRGTGTLTQPADATIQTEAAAALALHFMNAEDTVLDRTDSHLDCLIGELPFQPDGGVAYGELDTDGNLVALTGHPSGNRDLLVQVAPSDSPIAPGGHLTVLSPGTAEFFGLYDSLPSSETFMADMDRLFGREIGVLSAVNRAEDGTLSMTISGTIEESQP